MKTSLGADLELLRLPRRAEIGDYDWFDIEWKGTQVGKSRCRLEDDRITVFSIMIYPEYEGRGFARSVIDHFKASSPILIADRVRCTAREFWIKMDFVAESLDRYVWRGRS